MIKLFLKGGPIMWPLLLTSIVAIAAVIERLIRLRDEGPQCIFLKGNHEDMFLGFLGEGGRQAMRQYSHRMDALVQQLFADAGSLAMFRGSSAGDGTLPEPRRLQRRDKPPPPARDSRLRARDA
jgi:hypothetical protein